MSEAYCNTFSPMQQGADDAVDAVDDEDAQEVGHGHDDEAQGADDDGDDAEDDEAQGQFDAPREAGRDDMDAAVLAARFLFLAQPFFIEGLLVVDRTIFVNGLTAETVPFVIGKDFGIF